jgi:hypothetical protein
MPWAATAWLIAVLCIVCDFDSNRLRFHLDVFLEAHRYHRKAKLTVWIVSSDSCCVSVA